jgi:hypothetical protein
MAQPQVSVEQAAPTVTVEQGEPVVRVGSDTSKGTGQSEVLVESGQSQIVMSEAQQATVSISEAQPQVRYNAAQPEVQVSSEGEPQVQFNQSSEARVQIQQLSADGTPELAEQPASQMQDQATAQSELTAQPTADDAQDLAEQPASELQTHKEAQAELGTQTAADDAQDLAEQPASQTQDQTTAQSEQTAPPVVTNGRARDDENTAVSAASTRDMESTVGEIIGYTIVDRDMKKIGDIEKVVSVNNRLYTVISTGGFLGFGEDSVAIALSSLVLSDNTLIASAVPGTQIATLDGFRSAANPALDDEYRVTIGTM